MVGRSGDGGQSFSEWLRGAPRDGISDHEQAHEQELARGMESRLAQLYSAASAAVERLFHGKPESEKPE
jgi:hypothetical protein